MAMFDDEYVNYFKSRSTCTGPTANEEVVPTGLTYVLQGIGIEIWEVIHDLDFPADLPSSGNIEWTFGGLTAESGLGSAFELIDIPTLYMMLRELMGGTPTYLPLLMREGGHPPIYQPKHPKLYAFPELYHVADSTNSVQTCTSDVEISFMYVDLGKEGYYEVLQSYLQLWGS